MGVTPDAGMCAVSYCIPELMRCIGNISALHCSVLILIGAVKSGHITATVSLAYPAITDSTTFAAVV